MKKSLVLALFSGILYVLSFAPWDQSYLAWIALVPLLFAIQGLNTFSNQKWLHFLVGLITSIIIGAGGFYWVIYATQEYGGLPLYAALLLFIAFCLSAQLQIPLFLLMRRAFLRQEWFKTRIVLRAFTLAIFYAGIESFYPKLFSDTFGNAFSHSSYIRQSADLGGPFLLTFLIIATNELTFEFLTSKKIKYGIIALSIPALTFFYGSYRNHQYQELIRTQKSAPTFKAAVIQANIGDYLKVAAERGVQSASTQVMDQYVSLSTSALQSDDHPDAIVWPETAYPAIFDRPLSSVELEMQNRMELFTRSMKPYFIFGGYDSDSQGLEYNSVVFYEPRTKKKEVYHKSILLMFGETLPFADFFPSMKNWFPTMGFFGRGAGPQVYEVTNQKGERFNLAPSICYEGLFTDFSAKGARLGADLLLNLTNDSWFGPNGEPDLHLALTNFRSIETRLPMLRSTNTGYSVWIDPMGAFTKITSLGKAEILHAEFQKRVMPESPYLRISRIFGDNWFVELLEILTGAGLLLIWLKNRRN
jgi:apolipoprotein N-acyltransferase